MKTAGLHELEPAAEWRAGDIADPDAWTLRLSEADHAELDAALAVAKHKSADPLELTRGDFPLDRLATKLGAVVDTLLDGRGFTRIAALQTARYDDDDLTLLYWGIGLHVGEPWAQNKHGHVLGDVTDQGKTIDDPTVRGNELGGVALDYHTDGSDLVGLLCLRTARRGGLSCVANAVAIHNHLVRERPDLAAELYRPQPYDFRGEQAPGGRPWYAVPVFTRWGDRLFVRVIRPYILASQRHAEAPRLTDLAREALQWLDDEAEGGRYSVLMGFEPGDMQFVNNFHVLHGRTAYQDDRPSGRVRHLKRLWLETEVLADRPPYFRKTIDSHWNRKPAISRLDAVG